MKKDTNGRSGITSVQLQPEILKLMQPYLKRGISKTSLINTALRQHLLDQEFEELRRQLVPLAQAKGIYTDEDVERLLK